MDKVNEFADYVVSKEVEFVLMPFLQFLKDSATYIVHGLTDVMPELAVLIAMGCLSIGMFGNFGKWALRASGAVIGGATWIILASAS